MPRKFFIPPLYCAVADKFKRLPGVQAINCHMKFPRGILVLCFAIWSCAYAAFGQTKTFWDSLPKPIGHINDFEKIFTEREIGILERKVLYFEKNNRVQIVIITMDSSNVPLNRFDSLTFRIANYWNVGTKYGDRGVVIGISKGHRAMFILPGQGLNHIMTQTVNQALMDNHFFPYFRQKRYFEGTYHGLNRIIDLIEFRLKLNRLKDSQGKKLMGYEVKFDKGLFYYEGKLFTGIGIDMWNEKQLKSEISFKNGKIDGVARSYHENGNLQSQRFWKEGKGDGEFKVYSESGQLLKEGTYKNGQMDGIWKEYFENGKLKAEMSYTDGKLDGVVKEFDRTGKLKSQATYKGGEKIE